MQVLIGEDERFHREGGDLVTVLEVPATTAMLGATLPVETLEGEREVEVEAGVQHGDSVRLKGEGLPSLRSPQRRGDLHVAIKVVTPVNLGEEQRELAEQLDGDARGRQRSGRSARGPLRARATRLQMSPARSSGLAGPLGAAGREIMNRDCARFASGQP